MHRALKDLPILGREAHALLTDLVSGEGSGEDAFYRGKIEHVETMCAFIIQELWNQRLSDSNSSFLLDHGPSVQSRIEDASIRNLNVLTG